MSQVLSVREAVEAIEAHIKSRGGPCSAWYCGIAAAPSERLFSDHNVDQEKGRWCWRNCGTDIAARQVEAYFHKKGCEGGPSGGDRDTKYVYAYKITNTTVEAA